MKREEIRRAIAEYDFDLNRLMLTYKRPYSDKERQEIFRLCRKISRIGIPKCEDSNEPIKEDVIRPFFLRSLKVFDNTIVNDFFAEKTSKIKIVKDSGCEPDGANLNFSSPRNASRNYKISLPKKRVYTFTDQMSYAHEVGHIPEIDLPRRSFLEYNETLPMLMEYLMELRKHKGDEKSAIDYFLIERLPMEQREAQDIMKIYKIANSSDEDVRLYHGQQFVDYYKYLESLDYTIQLTDRMKEDRGTVGREIAKVIMGKSMTEVADDLEIETDGCKRLLREYKRVSRM